jgi:topoisomerase-4 subunit B
MNAAELKETTMDPRKRRMLRVEIDQDARAETTGAVSDLMGTKPEARFRFISERAEFVSDEVLDI